MVDILRFPQRNEVENDRMDCISKQADPRNCHAAGLPVTPTGRDDEKVGIDLFRIQWRHKMKPLVIGSS